MTTAARATTSTAIVDVQVPPALWSNNASTDASMESTSGKVTVYGLTHSNDDLRLRGDTKTFHGPVEYVRTLDTGGGGAVFDVPPVRTAVKPFPITFADERLPAGRPGIDEGGRRLPRHVGVVLETASGRSTAPPCRAASITSTARPS